MASGTKCNFTVLGKLCDCSWCYSTLTAHDRAVLDATVAGEWNEGQSRLLSVQTASRDRASTELP